MLNLLICIIFFIGIYSGVRRGLILQAVHTTGYIATFFVAHRYYLQLADYLEMFVPYASPGVNDNMVYYELVEVLKLDLAFYRALSFLLIFAAGWLLTRLLGYMLQSLAFLPIMKQLNSIGGGVLGFLMQYAGVFLILSFLTLIPFEAIQNALESSSIANWMITNTPYLTNTIFNWWIAQT